MEFQWDAIKNALNEKKHGVDFELAKEVFEDPFHNSILSPGTARAGGK